MFKKIYGRLKNIIQAAKGKTSVSMRGYCFNCKQNFYVELYQDFLFPVNSKCGCADGCRFDMVKFNGFNYHPSVRTDLQKLYPSILENCRTGH